MNKRPLIRGVLAGAIWLATPTVVHAGSIDDSLDALAQRLTHGGNLRLVVLAPEAKIASFDGKTLDATSLDSRFHGGTIVARLGYDGVPRSLATDLARAVAESKLPATVQQSFIPRDPEMARRADAIAAEWVHQALHVEAGQKTGVIAVWQPAVPAEAGRPAIEAQMLFVLVRAEQDPATGGWRITRGLLGDTEQACAN